MQAVFKLLRKKAKGGGWKTPSRRDGVKRYTNQHSLSFFTKTPFKEIVKNHYVKN